LLKKSDNNTKKVEEFESLNNLKKLELYVNYLSHNSVKTIDAVAERDINISRY